MRRSTFISIALMSAAVTWMFVDAIPGLAGRVMAEQTDRDYPEPEIDIVAVAAASLEADPLPEPKEPKEPKETYGPWRKTHATFYGPFYDSGPGRFNRTSDKTPYRPDGMFCATYLVPLGTVIEVKRGKVVLRLVVRDRPAKVNGHKVDIPTKTWDKFGAKRSIGKLPVEWRVVRP